MAFLMLYVTYPNKESAKESVRELLDEKWIACANIREVDSMYVWKGEMESEGEYIAVMKTRLELESDVAAKIKSIHPYEVPCITRWTANANDEFEEWIIENTRKNEV